MGIAKCIKCNNYIDENEAVFVEIDENHDACYCVSCAPDDAFSDDDTYDPDDDSRVNYEDE